MAGILILRQIVLHTVQDLPHLALGIVGHLLLVEEGHYKVEFIDFDVDFADLLLELVQRCAPRFGIMGRAGLLAKLVVDHCQGLPRLVHLPSADVNNNT